MQMNTDCKGIAVHSFTTSKYLYILYVHVNGDALYTIFSEFRWEWKWTEMKLTTKYANFFWLYYHYTIITQQCRWSLPLEQNEKKKDEKWFWTLSAYCSDVHSQCKTMVVSNWMQSNNRHHVMGPYKVLLLFKLTAVILCKYRFNFSFSFSFSIRLSIHTHTVSLLI